MARLALILVGLLAAMAQAHPKRSIGGRLLELAPYNLARSVPLSGALAEDLALIAGHPLAETEYLVRAIRAAQEAPGSAVDELPALGTSTHLNEALRAALVGLRLGVYETLAWQLGFFDEHKVFATEAAILIDQGVLRSSMEAALRTQGLLSEGYTGPIGRFFALADHITGDVDSSLDFLNGRLRTQPDAAVVILAEREDLRDAMATRALDPDATAVLALAFHAAGDSRLGDLDLDGLTAPRFRMVPRLLLRVPAPDGNLHFTRAYWFNQWSGALLDPHLGP